MVGEIFVQLADCVSANIKNSEKLFKILQQLETHDVTTEHSCISLDERSLNPSILTLRQRSALINQSGAKLTRSRYDCRLKSASVSRVTTARQNVKSARFRKEWMPKGSALCDYRNA